MTGGDRETCPLQLLRLVQDRPASSPPHHELPPPPPKPLALRIRYRVAGGHIHCRIFTAPSILDTFALAGELTFAKGEWPALRALLEPVAELLPEEP